jgi:hypothetical protein
MRLWQHIRTLFSDPVPVPAEEPGHTIDPGGETLRTFWTEVTGDECCYGQALRLGKTTRRHR